MTDALRVLEHAAKLRASNLTFAVATVVGTEGSTYRRTGARALVSSDGTTHGTITGGCLSGELIEESLCVLESRTPVLRTYDLRNEPVATGYGAGCDGLVKILFALPERTLELLEVCTRERRPSILAQVIEPGPALGQMYRFTGTVQNEEVAFLDEAVHAAAGRGLRARRTRTVRSRSGEVLLEYMPPPVRLVVFGNGDDVDPLIQVASILGWAVEVVGKLPPERLQERFPNAGRCTYLMHPDALGARVELDDRCAVVIMNHNLARDMAIAESVVDSPVPYVGLLGPRARVRRIMSNLAPRDHERCFGPAGLDTGSESAEEIALAITAEILAVMNGRSGQHLRRGDGAIHSR